MPASTLIAGRYDRLRTGMACSCDLLLVQLSGDQGYRLECGQVNNYRALWFHISLPH